MGIWFGQVGSWGPVQSNLGSKHLGATLQLDISICIVQHSCWPKLLCLICQHKLVRSAPVASGCWCFPFRPATLGAHTVLVGSSNLRAERKNSNGSIPLSQHTQRTPKFPSNCQLLQISGFFSELVNLCTKLTFLHTLASAEGAPAPHSPVLYSVDLTSTILWLSFPNNVFIYILLSLLIRKINVSTDLL